MNAITTIQPADNGIYKMIDDHPKLADSTKMQYKKALRHYLETGESLGNAEAVAAYALTLCKSSRSFLKAAIRLWGEDVALKAKSGATPENVASVQATIYRIEALNQSIKVEESKGQKAHIWLSAAEVRRLLAAIDTDTSKGLRDKIVLGLLLAAGLRRAELCALCFDDIKKQPVKGKMRTVLQVQGKGSKNRVIPIKDELAKALERWAELCGGSGKVARSVKQTGEINGSLSPIGCFKVVNDSGSTIGKPKLAPHDLRRTYAQLGFEAGVPITQISTLLGHASVATTQRYLNLELNLEETVSDFIPFD